jgi:hypothetical protein
MVGVGWMRGQNFQAGALHEKKGGKGRKMAGETWTSRAARGNSYDNRMVSPILTYHRSKDVFFCPPPTAPHKPHTSYRALKLGIPSFLTLTSNSYAVKGKIIEIIYKYLKGYFSRSILSHQLHWNRPSQTSTQHRQYRPNSTKPSCRHLDNISTGKMID